MNPIAHRRRLKPSDASDLMLKKYFNLSGENAYPSILFFQVKNRSIIDSFIVPLKEREDQKAFEEIRDIMELAERTLKITKFDGKNHQEIFNQVRGAIDHKFAIKGLLDGAKKIGGIIRFIAPLRHFFGSV
ncbi:MAG: hypothetical protein U0T74_01190 [Chitinophagales bacterium]